MKRLSPVLVVLFAAIGLATCPDNVVGCGGAVRPGERLDVIDETALIVWDSKTSTQHFIRRAAIRGSGYDVGFLVPTPNRPELGTAENDLFQELVTLTAPRVEFRTVNGISLGCEDGSIRPRGGARFLPGGGVAILEQKRVGDFDAAILAFAPDAKNDPATATAELAAWLTRNGYAFTPSLQAWLEPYVRNGWVVTAFKIAVDPKPAEKQDGNAKPAVNLGARPVRMSFKTDRPFFPYREPDDQRDEQAKSVPRYLRVFVAAPTRFAGKLGDGSQPWPGKTVWADQIESPQWANVFKQATLPASPAMDGWWLTEFEDRSSPRPGTDEVYFEPAVDTSPVHREPVIFIVQQTPWWYGAVYCGLPATLLLVGILTGRWLIRRKKDSVTSLSPQSKPED